MATRFDDQTEEDLRIERAVVGPRGSVTFGRDWLLNMGPEEYRNYLCRAFAYC